MKRRVILLAGAVLAACAALGALLVYRGVILLNNPSRSQFPVRGVDVSSYQGDIDWQVLAGQGIDFAYIKATEGSGTVDRCFAQNFARARQTSLRIGAYHFFSFDSAGETQAANFIATVPVVADALPPVVDVEFYGDKQRHPPEPDAVRGALDALLAALERHYGKKPILYATAESYDAYLAKAYAAYDIWIREVIGRPTLSDDRAWTFWQYANRARLEGYVGKERFIDMNVFAGTVAEFAAYGE